VTRSNATSPRVTTSSFASGFSGTALFASSTPKKSSSAGRRKNSEEAKETALSSRPMSSVANPMKETISPTSARPARCSRVPSTTMLMTAMVLAARVSTLTTAHQFSTGNWCAITCCAMSPNSRVSAASRVKDCTTVTLASASCAVLARLELNVSTRRCASSVERRITVVTAM